MKDITRLRWGVDLRRGGIFPKRVYVAVFGTPKNEYTIKTRQKDFYEHLADRYWKAVGRRLLSEMMDGLASGKKYRFGDVTVEDEGITVTARSAFSSAKESYHPWSELIWGIVNGSLCFARKEEPNKILAGCFPVGRQCPCPECCDGTAPENEHVKTEHAEDLRVEAGTVRRGSGMIRTPFFILAYIIAVLVLIS